MPRTKVSRNAKRNRDAAKDEALLIRTREFDLFVDQYLSRLDFEHQKRLEQQREITNMIRTMPEKILSMKMCELMEMEAKTINEVNALIAIKNTENRNAIDSSLLRSSKKKSRDDEGYLTEDSNGHRVSTGYKGVSRVMTASTRVMGPLTSAKAKSRHRRSRSACSALSTIGVSSTSTRSSSHVSSQPLSTKKSSAVDRMSRSKTRTHLENRTKAASADRAAPVTPKICPNTPLSMLRYPRFGETVISLTGSPIVAQGISDGIASVNIPIKDGVLSLRPTRLESIDKDFINRIDDKAILQMKELQSNLNKLMKIFDKVNAKM